MTKKSIHKPLGHTIWLKVIITFAMFAPPLTKAAYDPANITNVIESVLSNPLSLSYPWYCYLWQN